MKKQIVLLLILLASGLILASTKIDSLQLKMANTSGKAKLKIIYELSEIYKFNDPAKCIELGQIALEISKENKFAKEECEALKIIGVAYSLTQEYDKAIETLDAGMLKAKQIGYTKIIPAFHFRYGNHYADRYDYKTALIHYEEAKRLWVELDQKNDIAGISLNLGNLYNHMTEYEKAKDNYEQSITLFKELNDLFSLATVTNNLGHIYMQTDDHEKALEMYLQSLEIREKLGIDSKIAFSLYTIGNFYLKKFDYEVALNYHTRALDYFTKIEDNKMLLMCYNSLGIAYKYLEDTEKAISYYTKALSLAEEINDISIEGLALNNLAIIYQESGNVQRSLKYYQQAIELNIKTNDYFNHAASLNNIGSLYTSQGEYDKAERSLTKSLKLTKEFNNPTLLSKIYKSFSDLYSKQGKYKKALENFKHFTTLNDSLNSIAKDQVIAEIQTKYDTEKKEKEIETLTYNSSIQSFKLTQHKNQLYISIFIGALIIVFSIIIFRIKQKQIQAQKKVEIAIKKLNAELEKRVQEELEKQKEQQQLLIQKSKLESIGKLAAGIAHEINQPLGGISMGLENINFAFTDGRLSSKYLDEKLEQIDGYFDRINQIIDHIRIFSRDQKSIIFESIDLNEAVGNALFLLQTQYENHNVLLEINLSKTISKTSGNKYKLEQVILNLLTNAKDAIEEKNRIKNNSFHKIINLKTYEDDFSVILEVEDNGTGIQKDIIEKIFDPFFSTKDPTKGTGLGLSIIYGIIKEMKGDILVESEVDNFTKMIVTLPKN